MPLSDATPRAPRGPADDGFTLIELLISIVILGVISGALGNAVIGYLRNSGATSDRLALSHDAQISSAYFSRDVSAVGRRDYTALPDVSGNTPYLASIQLSAAYNSGGVTCGTATTPVALVRFLSDDWDSSSPPALTTDVVAYYLLPAGTVSELHRLRCTGATVVSDAVLAHYVTGTPAITCSTSCTGSTPPQQVTLSLTVSRPSVGAYPISLTAQRRQT